MLSGLQKADDLIEITRGDGIDDVLEQIFFGLSTGSDAMRERKLRHKGVTAVRVFAGAIDIVQLWMFTVGFCDNSSVTTIFANDSKSHDGTYLGSGRKPYHSK